METPLRLTITRRTCGLLPSLSLVVGLLVLVAACTSLDEVPLLEQRAQKLNEAVMCPVCPGESIDQSQNPLAVQMRGIVVEKLEQGWTEEQIKEFFVERYGPSVLLEPPGSGVSIAAWIIPPVAFFVGIIAVAFALRTMSRARKPAPDSGITGVRLSDDEHNRYTRMIETALENEGEGKG